MGVEEEVRLCGRVDLLWGWPMSRRWTADGLGVGGRAFQAEYQDVV